MVVLFITQNIEMIKFVFKLLYLKKITIFVIHVHKPFVC